MKLSEYQRHDILRELIPSVPYAQLASRLVLPSVSSQAQGSQGVLRRLVAGASQSVRLFGRRWKRSTEREVAIAEMRRIGPQLLADIGLERGDIEHVVDTMLDARDAQASRRGALVEPTAAELVNRR